MIFVDTSAWFALLSEEDVHPWEATEALQKIRTGRHGDPLTTDYVLDEAFTLLRSRSGIDPVRRLGALVRYTSALRRVWIGDHAFEDAFEMMVSHGD